MASLYDTLSDWVDGTAGFVMSNTSEIYQGLSEMSARVISRLRRERERDPNLVGFATAITEAPEFFREGAGQIKRKASEEIARERDYRRRQAELPSFERDRSLGPFPPLARLGLGVQDVAFQSTRAAGQIIGEDTYLGSSLMSIGNRGIVMGQQGEDYLTRLELQAAPMRTLDRIKAEEQNKITFDTLLKNVPKIVGGQVSFLIPSAGVASGVTAVASRIPAVGRLAGLLGTTGPKASAALGGAGGLAFGTLHEASLEMSAVYDRERKQGKSREQASNAAGYSFWKNVAIGSVAEVPDVLLLKYLRGPLAIDANSLRGKDLMGGLRRTSKAKELGEAAAVVGGGAVVEGGQELAQEVIAEGAAMPEGQRPSITQILAGVPELAETPRGQYIATQSIAAALLFGGAVGTAGLLDSAKPWVSMGTTGTEGFVATRGLFDDAPRGDQQPKKPVRPTPPARPTGQAQQVQGTLPFGMTEKAANDLVKKQIEDQSSPTPPVAIGDPELPRFTVAAVYRAMIDKNPNLPEIILWSSAVQKNILPAIEQGKKTIWEPISETNVRVPTPQNIAKSTQALADLDEAYTAGLARYSRDQVRRQQQRIHAGKRMDLVAQEMDRREARTKMYYVGVSEGGHVYRFMDPKRDVEGVGGTGDPVDLSRYRLYEATKGTNAELRQWAMEGNYDGFIANDGTVEVFIAPSNPEGQEGRIDAGARHLLARIDAQRQARRAGFEDLPVLADEKRMPGPVTEGVAEALLAPREITASKYLPTSDLPDTIKEILTRADTADVNNPARVLADAERGFNRDRILTLLARYVEAEADRVSTVTGRTMDRVAAERERKGGVTEAEARLSEFEDKKTKMTPEQIRERFLGRLGVKSAPSFALARSLLATWRARTLLASFARSGVPTGVGVSEISYKLSAQDLMREIQAHSFRGALAWNKNNATLVGRVERAGGGESAIILERGNTDSLKTRTVTRIGTQPSVTPTAAAMRTWAAQQFFTQKEGRERMSAMPALRSSFLRIPLAATEVRGEQAAENILERVVSPTEEEIAIGYSPDPLARWEPPTRREDIKIPFTEKKIPFKSREDILRWIGKRWVPTLENLQKFDPEASLRVQEFFILKERETARIKRAVNPFVKAWNDFSKEDQRKLKKMLLNGRREPIEAFARKRPGLQILLDRMKVEFNRVYADITGMVLEPNTRNEWRNPTKEEIKNRQQKGLTGIHLGFIDSYHPRVFKDAEAARESMKKQSNQIAVRKMMREAGFNLDVDPGADQLISIEEADQYIERIERSIKKREGLTQAERRDRNETLLSLKATRLYVETYHAFRSRPRFAREFGDQPAKDFFNALHQLSMGRVTPTREGAYPFTRAVGQKRTVEFISNDILDMYEDPPDGLDSYAARAGEAIAYAKVFGGQELRTVQGGMIDKDATAREIAYLSGTRMMERFRKAGDTAAVQRIEQDVAHVEYLIKTALNRTTDHGITSTLRGVGYMLTLNTPLTVWYQQVIDLVATGAVYGFRDTARQAKSVGILTLEWADPKTKLSLYRIIPKEKRGTKVFKNRQPDDVDVPIDIKTMRDEVFDGTLNELPQEKPGRWMMNFFVKYSSAFTKLQQGDNFTKNTTINALYHKARKEAKTREGRDRLARTPGWRQLRIADEELFQRMLVELQKPLTPDDIKQKLRDEAEKEVEWFSGIMTPEARKEAIQAITDEKIEQARGAAFMSPEMQTTLLMVLQESIPLNELDVPPRYNESEFSRLMYFQLLTFAIKRISQTRTHVSRRIGRFQKNRHLYKKEYVETGNLNEEYAKRANEELKNAIYHAVMFIFAVGLAEASHREIKAIFNYLWSSMVMGNTSDPDFQLGKTLVERWFLTSLFIRPGELQTYTDMVNPLFGGGMNEYTLSRLFDGRTWQVVQEEIAVPPVSSLLNKSLQSLFKWDMDWGIFGSLGRPIEKRLKKQKERLRGRPATGFGLPR